MATVGAVAWPIASYAPPRAKSTRTTNTGFSSHTRVRLCSSRLARVQTQTTKTTRAGGQTHPSASTTAFGANSTSTPDSAMKIAGTIAQRCGWSVNRVDRTAMSAHPRAKPNSTIAVEKSLSTVPTGRNGRITAAAKPAASEPATTRPTRQRRSPGTAGWSLLVGAVWLRNLMTGHLGLVCVGAAPRPRHRACADRRGKGRARSERLAM